MTTALPLVSIVIPCWGCREYIAEAIESAIAQDYANFEVVVVEDHGGDGTYELAKTYESERVRVVRNEQNLGQFGNKNRAIELARGDLIKILDGDDVLEPRAVRRLVEEWQRAGAGVGIVFGQFTVIDSAGNVAAHPRRWGLTGRLSGVAVLDHVTRMRSPGSMFGNVSAHLVDRRVLAQVGGFPHDNAGPGDLETFMKLLTVTDVVFLDEPIAKYRIHGSSMTGRTFGLREARDYVTMVDRLQQWFAQKPNAPRHLHTSEFFDDWRVWSSEHTTLASFQRKLRGMPSEFDAIRQFYRDRGLGRRFDRHIAARMPVYVARRILMGAKKRLDVPVNQSLFSRRALSRMKRS
jgi:glycosyltransferase involved in cell wall biosynthesis